MRKRITAMLLTLIMCFTMLAPTASAEPEKTKYKVVALGDSTANGFGNKDYGAYSRYDYTITEKGPAADRETLSCLGYGFLDAASERAYPFRIARYIQEQNPQLDVDFTSLTVSGIRNTELLSIIDPDYAGDSFTGVYCEQKLKKLEEVYGIDDLSAFFIDELSSADLITVDACLNSFTSYMSARISKAMNPLPADDPDFELYEDTLADAASAISPEINELIKPIAESIRKTFDGILPQNQITDIVDAAVYSLASCLANFSGIISRILEINDDARILVSGAYFPIRGKSWTFGDLKVDIGDLMTAVFGIIDNYICSVDINHDRYSFIDIPDDIEVFIDYFGSADTMWDIDPDILRELIDELFGSYPEIADRLCAAAVEKGAAQGLDISAYYPMYSDSLCETVENVRKNGESAPEMEKLLSAEFERFFSYLFAGAGTTELDIMTAAGASGNMTYSDILDLMDTIPAGELSREQLTKIFFLDMEAIGNGMLAHFSPKGCDQKYEVALKAYLSDDTAADVSYKLALELRHDFRKGLFSTFAAPLIGLLHSVLDGIIDSLRSLFSHAPFISFR